MSAISNHLKRSVIIGNQAPVYACKDVKSDVESFEIMLVVSL